MLIYEVRQHHYPFIQSPLDSIKTKWMLVEYFLIFIWLGKIQGEWVFKGWLISAILRPSALDDVREALSNIGIKCFTIIEVKGFGSQKGNTELYRSARYQTEFLPRINLRIAIESQHAKSIVDAIATSANTGKAGDGKIFVTSLSKIIRIWCYLYHC